MKKTILTVAGSVLIVLSTVQFAAASEYRSKVHHRGAAAATQFRDSNAYAGPAYGAAQPEWYRYKGGIWGQAGH
jgi:hypothetical protein